MSNIALENLQHLRISNNWSQELLSELSGISTRTIQRIESGKKSSQETAKALAATFDFKTVQPLLTCNQKPPKEKLNEIVVINKINEFHLKIRDKELSILIKLYPVVIFLVLLFASIITYQSGLYEKIISSDKFLSGSLLFISFTLLLSYIFILFSIFFIEMYISKLTKRIIKYSECKFSRIDTLRLRDMTCDKSLEVKVQDAVKVYLDHNRPGWQWQ